MRRQISFLIVALLLLPSLALAQTGYVNLYLYSDSLCENGAGAAVSPAGCTGTPSIIRDRTRSLAPLSVAASAQSPLTAHECMLRSRPRITVS